MSGPPDDAAAEGAVGPGGEGVHAGAGQRPRGRHVGKPAGARRATRPATHDPAHRAAPPAEPVLPRGPDESDVGWGARPAPDDDERLRREVPPHWQ